MSTMFEITPADEPRPSTGPDDRTSDQHEVSRRTLLRTSLVAGGAALAATALPSGVAFAKGPVGGTVGNPATTGAVAAAASGTGGLTFFADPSLDFMARFALGAAGYGTAEAGEVITAINQANAEGGTYQAYVDAFVRQGDRLASFADQTRARGDRVTAREAHLRAAEYYTQALFFVLGTTTPNDEESLFKLNKRSFDAACELSSPKILKVAIPYEKTTMPGYLLRPDTSGRARPTVIVNNGSDGQSVETYAYGGLAAVQRGWNALMFEGPGQGTTLFERQVPFRPDWEKVVTPVVDFLRGRDDVDGDRIALTGWSMGGELVMRAAAFEPRLAAVVADPGCVDVWAAWPESLRRVAEAGDAATVNGIWANDVVPFLTPEEAFNIKKRSEIFGKEFLDEVRAGNVPSDFKLLSDRIKAYAVDRDVLARVQMPTLVVNYEDEQFYPGQAHELFEMLTTKQKDLVDLTVAEGAQFHCAPMAPQLRNEIVFDWLQRTLGT